MRPRKRQRRVKDDRRGMTMLLALILLASVTAAGIGAAVLIVTEFNTRVSSDNGIKAFYAADAGMERALFTIFNGRLAGSSFSATSTDCTANWPYNTMDVCLMVAGNYPEMPQLLDGATVSLAKTSRYDASATVTIPRDQTVEYNYAGFSKTYTGLVVAPRSIVISAPDIPTHADCAGEEDTIACMKKVPGIEVKWSYLLGTGYGTGVSDNAPANSTARVYSLQDVKKGVKTDLFTGTPSSIDGTTSPALMNPSGVTEIPSGINFNNISGWIIRVTALSDAIPNMTLTACKGEDDCTNSSNTGQVFKRSNSISVMSQGVVGGSSVTLNAKVPWYIPSSGIFDYAIFSEKSLVPG